MSLAGQLFRFYIYSNLFIASCAVLMVFQTCMLLLGHPPDPAFTCFVFFATLCSYSFHWFLTPADSITPSARTVWISEYRGVHTLFFIIGLVGSAASAFFLLAFWPWLLLSAFITFLYSAPKIPHPWFRLLRKVARGKTFFLALVWAHVTTVLPLLVSDREWTTAFSLFSASRFFLIYAICILFDYRDREYDRQLGIRSLITWFSEKGITRLFLLSMLAFLGFTVSLLQWGISLQTIVLLLIPGAITISLYKFAKRNFSDMLYYFVLDGLMALSAFLSLFLPS